MEGIPFALFQALMLSQTGVDDFILHYMLKKGIWDIVKAG